MKKVRIIDVDHMIRSLFFMNNKPKLESAVRLGDSIVYLDTTILNHVLKRVMFLSHNGNYPTFVTFTDSIKSKTKHIDELYNYEISNNLVRKNKNDKTKNVYKKGKTEKRFKGNKLMTAKDIIIKVLNSAGVSAEMRYDYEASDIVTAAVFQAKKQYPEYKIEVITDNPVLIGLVDEQTSVYLRSQKTTLYDYEDENSEQIKKYIQITPNNFENALVFIGDFGDNINSYYNNYMFYYLTRGLGRDNVKMLRKWTPTKFNDFMLYLEEYNFDLTNLCRVGESTPIIKNNSIVGYNDSIEFLTFKSILDVSINDKEIKDALINRYKILLPNQPYITENVIERHPYVVNNINSSFDFNHYSDLVKSMFNINIEPYVYV